MKHLLVLCLPLLLLTACRSSVEESPFPDRPAESIVAEAVITEGRTPEENYDLPTECMDLRAWDVQDYPLALLAELPEADAAFYGLAWDTALIRWGNSLAEFNWLFATPRSIPPRIWQLDLDNDWQDELIIDCYVDGGAGVSIEELHVIEKNADDTLTDYAFPEALWKERILEMAWLSSSGGYRAYVQMGSDSIEFSTEDIVSGDHSLEGIKQHFGTSELAYFESINGGLRLNGSFYLETEDWGNLHNVANYSASITYLDGVFMLTDFHLTDGYGSKSEAAFPDRPAESIVAEAVITEGRTPEENYDLPTSFTTDLALWDVQKDGPALLTELSEANAAFYGLDYEKALIRWGSSLAEFDWSFGTPRGILPQIWQFDIDGDWQNELIIDCYAGSGTGVSIEELHILEKNADNTLTAYTFPEAAWREQLWKQAALSCGENRGCISFGRDMVEFDIDDIPEDALKEPVETGEIASFEVSKKNIVLKGAFCLDRESRGGLQYIADYSASMIYQNGMFLLTDFHLSEV